MTIAWQLFGWPVKMIRPEQQSCLLINLPTSGLNNLVTSGSSRISELILNQVPDYYQYEAGFPFWTHLLKKYWHIQKFVVDDIKKINESWKQNFYIAYLWSLIRAWFCFLSIYLFFVHHVFATHVFLKQTLEKILNHRACIQMAFFLHELKRSVCLEYPF